MKRYRVTLGVTVLAGALALLPGLARADNGGSFLGQFNRIKTLASTVPANGDVNPYGVAVVPRTMGTLVRGHVLVSNFNDSANQQGTGTTIVQVARDGSMSLFAQIDAHHLPGACPGGVGLTTALAVLRSGWVIVGSLPTTDGTAATAQAGCLLVLNSMGQVVETFSGASINGPWDMTALDRGSSAVLFVTNVLNGTVAGGGTVVNQGTVVRLTLAIPRGEMPHLLSSTVIGSGFPERTDPAALVIGPTGVGLAAGNQSHPGEVEGDSTRSAGITLNAEDGGAHSEQHGAHSGSGTYYGGYYSAHARGHGSPTARIGNRSDDQGNAVLYVADSLDNRIAAIPNALTRMTGAGTGMTVSAMGALNDPLGLAIAPNGDVLTVNGNDGRAVETTPAGAQIATKLLDSTGSPPGAGALFGLAVVPGSGHDGNNGGLYFVDDASNTLNLLH